MRAPVGLLPLPEPPHDPRSLLLSGTVGPDPRRGFRVREARGAEVHPASGTLVLEPAPDALRFMTEPAGTFGGLRPPINVAVTTTGDVYLLDPIGGRLLRFDPCCCRFEPVACATHVVAPRPPVCGDAADGRAPAPQPRPEPAQLADPHGLAVCGNDVWIADSGHGRIVRFSLAGFVAGPPIVLPRAEQQALPRGWFPVALAFDGRGRLHVGDPLNHRVDTFAPEGRWLETVALPAPVWGVAVDCEDRVYALLAQAARLAVTSDPHGGARWLLVETPGVPLDPRIVRLDGPRLVPVDPRADTAAGFGRGLLGVDARGFVHLVCPDGCGTFDARGMALPPEARGLAPRFTRRGTLRTEALDSRIEGCRWHRIELRGALPAGSQVALHTLTAEVELSDDEILEMDGAWRTGQTASAMPNGRWDCLVTSPPGRFLWLRLELAGDGQATPCVSDVVVEFPRISLRRFLPAVFGADPAGADFTDRFTAIFDTTLRSIETQIDRMVMRFDPLSAPAEAAPGRPDFLAWIAQWIGIVFSRDWPVARRRRYLKEAARLYSLRGTPRGLWQQLLLFLGFDQALAACPAERPQRRCPAPRPACAPPPALVPAFPPPLLLEHFRLRRWLFAGQGRLGEDSMLWGKRIVNRSQLSGPEPPPDQSGNAQLGVSQLVSTPDPLRDPFHVAAQRLSVFVPARVRDCGSERRALEQLLALETPAHVQYDVRYVEPRFRVGVQAMIGLDSVVARTPHGVRLERSALGRGTVLDGGRGRRSAAHLTVGDARVGTTTVVT